MEIKPEEYKLLHTFALWAYAKAFEEGSDFAKAAYAAACDLAGQAGIPQGCGIDDLVRCTDFAKVSPREIAKQFFDDADMLSPKLKAKVYAFDALSRYIQPTLLKTVDDRSIVCVSGLSLFVNKLEFEAIAAAKGGARL